MKRWENSIKIGSCVKWSCSVSTAIGFGISGANICDLPLS